MHRIVALLDSGPGDHVLEIGFGDGRTVPDVIAQRRGAPVPVDFSPTINW